MADSELVTVVVGKDNVVDSAGTIQVGGKLEDITEGATQAQKYMIGGGVAAVLIVLLAVYQYVVLAVFYIYWAGGGVWCGISYFFDDSACNNGPDKDKPWDLPSLFW